MTQATRPGARQLLPRAERRAAILSAAASAFVHKGFSATSMDDVAAEAGITKLIVYRHFDSKESLYEAVLEQVSARLAEEFVAGMAADPTGRGVGVKTLMTVAREDPDGFVLLWRHAAREPQFADYAERFREQSVDLARQLLDRTDVPGDRRLRRWQAELIMSFLVDAVVHWLEEGSPKRDEEMMRLTTRSMVAMVRAWA
ncbi:MAG TPA: helix-turn-helix domain-containing protein [Acidimicrobiales bacterium]|nr:helix-turn-helix domain-containing protein [Acidimicrobiales bacterium]